MRAVMQVYACLAEQLNQEACHHLLRSVLDGASGAALAGGAAAWETAEAIWLVDTAAALARKTGGAAQLAGLLRNSMQR